jgi:hexosaminidase
MRQPLREEKVPMKTTGFFHIFAWMVVVLLNSMPAEAASRIADLHLVPMPSQVQTSEGEFPINESFSVRVTGYENPLITDAAARFLQRMQQRTGIFFALQPASESQQPALEIHCRGAGEPVQSLSADESYALEITGKSARLTAPAPIGILRGLETLLQLVDLNSRSFYFPSLTIEDRPRFRWRGLLIDVSRHWQPLEVLKRNIDAMASFKMNVFHWHLSDDQGFRVESKLFPRLHQEGSDGNYYSQSEVHNLISYARSRGIRVIPEFDMPGHTTAWLVAYPELASAPGPYQIERSWGVFDPCMDPTLERLYAFLDSFIGEMARLFPDEYFHIGGDEVNGKQWNASARIRDFKASRNLKSNHDLQAYFNQRVRRILTKHGKKMIGWDEILHPDLPKSIVIQSWRGHASLADAARRGFSGILSYGYYLDHMQPASFHYAGDPLGREAANLAEEEKTRILGGEACMWAEFVTPDNIESRIWPRAAAIAERLWSQQEVRDVPDLYRRLEYVDRELDSAGLRYRAKYLEMLRRMAGDHDVAPLAAFAGLLKPSGLGVRQRSRSYSRFTPLNQLVDVLMPESAAARQIDILTDRFLADRSKASGQSRQLREQFAGWLDNDVRLRPTIEQSFLLSNLRGLAETIADLGRCGNEALDYLGSGEKPSESWRKAAMALLERADKPQAEILVAIVPSIRRLVEAANAMP